jgi:hypothetical protein
MIFTFWKCAFTDQRKFPAMKRLYASFTQLEPFQTLSLHIVPRQCLTTCVYEWKKDPLISGCLFLTISTHKYRINVPLSTIGSQQNQRTILNPFTMVLRKSKNWSKTLPGIINSFLILFRKTWWFFEICQKPNKMGSYFILFKTPNLGLFKILGPDITTINRYGTSWGLFYFFISLKTYREYFRVMTFYCQPSSSNSTPTLGLPITKHFFRSSSSAFHFEWFKMLWEHYLSSSRNHFWSANWKGVMKK